MAQGPTRPTVAALLALGTDAWAELLAAALPIVRRLPDDRTDPVTRRVAATPPGRLMAGRSRRDLATVLVRDEVWDLVEEALPGDAARPWEAGAAEGGTAPGDPHAGDLDRLRQQVEHLQGRERTLAEKVATLREEVEALRRERDGAVARAEAARAAQDRAEAELGDARAEAASARAAAEAADDRVAREVARLRRRDEGEAARLRAELREARREREEARHELSLERDRPTPVVATAAEPADPNTRRDDRGGRRGRPSRLPDGVTAGTRRAAEWLVGEGRVLLVDGYNVTRTHRSELPFPEQRRWLEAAVVALARRRHVEATIVWDSRHGAPTTRRNPAGVTVRFAPAEVTADDELVYLVEVMLDPDTPVVAVTDDVELRGRLAQHGVDLLDSQSFTWLL